jgi:hypothetical protein
VLKLVRRGEGRGGMERGKRREGRKRREKGGKGGIERGKGREKKGRKGREGREGREYLGQGQLVVVGIQLVVEQQEGLSLQTRIFVLDQFSDGLNKRSNFWKLVKINF